MPQSAGMRYEVREAVALLSFVLIANFLPQRLCIWLSFWPARRCSFFVAGFAISGCNSRATRVIKEEVVFPHCHHDLPAHVCGWAVV